MLKKIVIRGACQHNLKSIDVEIPRNELVVITGVSGSGKSSLAFDTLYAEGQRRYVESLSAYARQFLDRLQKPKVEHIEGLSPAIAIEQRTAGGTPRSTVATVTEIYDYLRLLYAHVGIPHCPRCGRVLASQSAQAITDRLMELPEGARLTLMAPAVKGRKGEHRDVLEKLRGEGFIRVRIDGEMKLLEEVEGLPKTFRHTIEVVVDRLVAGRTDRSRLNDSVETALRHGDGELVALVADPKSGAEREEKFCERLACPDCGVSFGNLLPRNFSFNSPYGRCEHCDGLGVELRMDPAKVIPDPSLSISNGAIPAWRKGPERLILYYRMLLRRLAEQLGEAHLFTTPFEKLPVRTREIILNGSGDVPLEFDFRMRGRKYHWCKPFEGVLANLQRRYAETESESMREYLGRFLSPHPCPECGGARLNPVSRAVTVGGLSLDRFDALPVGEALKFVSSLELSAEESHIAGEVLKEISGRLRFLCDVGLNYLTLDRVSSTLSGGEAQRIRLATQLGCGLTGVLYILDEPSIGLHQRDNGRLLRTLTKLRDLGNTVVVVEHDLETITSADYVLDLGPGAGSTGGEVVAAGTPAELPKFPRSLTGDYLSGRRRIEVPERRHPGSGKFLTIRGATLNNLKHATAKFPLGCFICVTGVSGSGKSSLVNGTLVRALNRKFGIADRNPGPCDAIEGIGAIDKMIVIDQSPIGRTPRSNPATYTGAFDMIRKLFSQVPEAKARGYTPGRFSFNVKGGRCEECRGDGIRKIEMQFLSDVYVECSACGGRRFNSETLAVTYKKHNIAEILDLTVAEALELFSAVPALARKIRTLNEVGLGYLKLGQAATTLSGGEAQRVKLAAELSRVPRGHTLYVLDEPTTGLHLADIDQLLKVLFRLRDLGNTVIVIEHNLDVIKTADYVIDLGPEGGDAGGEVIACGTPEEVARIPASHTGAYLAKELGLK